MLLDWTTCSLNSILMSTGVIGNIGHLACTCDFGEMSKQIHNLEHTIILEYKDCI